MATHVLVNVDEMNCGARIRVYRDNVKVDDYLIHDDADWRDHVPAGASVTVR